MALVVHEFKDSPKSEDDTDGSSAVSMASREEVKFNWIGKSEVNPIVEGIDYDPLEGHGLSTEHMHKSGFILSFQIVNKYHHQSHALDVGVELLLTKSIEKGHYENGS